MFVIISKKRLNLLKEELEQKNKDIENFVNPSLGNKTFEELVKLHTAKKEELGNLTYRIKQIRGTFANLRIKNGLTVKEYESKK